MDIRYGKKALVLFLVLVTLASAVVETIYVSGGSGYLIVLLMWIPALAAFAASLVSLKEAGEKFSLKKQRVLLGIRFCSLRYILLGVLIPFVYLLIPYLIYWKMYPDNFAYTGVPFSLIMQDLALYSLVNVLVGLITATGEEIGWRGFMFPALKERTGLNKAIAFTSLYWCLWHFPLLISGGYMDGTPLVYRLVSFVLCIFPVGIITALLREKSGSMWPAAFLHAAHNAFDQSVFGLITRGDNRMYFVSETGCLTILCAWIFAVLLYVLWVRTKNRKTEQ